MHVSGPANIPTALLYAVHVAKLKSFCAKFNPDYGDAAYIRSPRGSRISA
jgi:hypothetical protein